MTLKRFLLWFLFIDFVAFSSWVMWQVGYIGIWQAGFESPASLQILLDLVICCLLITSWIKKDAEQRGVNPYPWIIATVFSGSIAPLAYLLVREYKVSNTTPITAPAS
jgi:hypothetical protein